jgi:hypothetical protein
MRHTTTARLRFWPAMLVAALALALPGALAGSVAGSPGPALDTGLYHPDGFDGPTYQPGAPIRPPRAARTGRPPGPVRPSRLPQEPAATRRPKTRVRPTRMPGPVGGAPTPDAGGSELADLEPASEPPTETKTKEQARKETDTPSIWRSGCSTSRTATTSSAARPPAGGIDARSVLQKLITDHAPGGQSRAEGGNGKIYDFHDVRGPLVGDDVEARASVSRVGAGADGYSTCLGAFTQIPPGRTTTAGSVTASADP